MYVKKVSNHFYILMIIVSGITPILSNTTNELIRKLMKYLHEKYGGYFIFRTGKRLGC